MDEPIRILLVEDLPVDADLAKREIAKSLKSCAFRCVDTREEYLEALEAFRPDLIVSDYRMPRFDGLSALRLALERTPLTPLIMLTGSMNEDTAVECMKAGATNYVIKEHIKRLGQTVVHALDEKRVRVERHRVQEALRESEERFRSVYENATIGLYRIAPEGRIQMANPAAIRMLGYDSLDDLLQSCDTDYARGPLAIQDDYRRQLEAGGTIAGLERALARRDGTAIFVRESVRAIRDANGVLLSFDGTFEDITERKQAEERIRQEAARTHTLVRTAGRLNATLDLDAALAAVCDEAAKALHEDIVQVSFYDEMAETVFPAMTTGLPPDDRRYLPRVPLQAIQELTQGSVSVFRIPDLRHAPFAPAEVQQIHTDIRSLTCAIMRYGDRLMGTLGVISVGQERILSPDEEALLAGIADQAAMAISNARLFTQQRLAEQALRESEERYRTLVQTLPDALTVVDTQGIMTYVTPAAVQLLGCESEAELLGRCPTDWIDPSCHADFRDAIVQILGGGHVRNREFLIHNKVGTEFFGDVSASCLYDSHKRAMGIITIVRDISDRKRAEEALRESEERYRTLAEAANDAIYIIDAEDRFRYINQFGARLVGLLPEKVIGRRRDEFFPAPDPAARALALRRVLDQGEVAHEEHAVATRCGEVWLGTTLVPLGNRDVAIGTALGISRDITERKRADEALLQSEALYRTRTEELEVLFTLSTLLREAQTAKDLLAVVLREMRRAVDMDAAAVLLLEPEGDSFRVALADGNEPHFEDKVFSAGEGPMGEVLRTRKLYVTQDYATDPLQLGPAEQIRGMGPAILVPLQSEETILGILMAVRSGASDREPFSPQAARLLTAMGEMVGNTLRRTRLFDDVQRHLRRTQALHEIQLAMASSFDLRMTLNTVLDQAQTQLQVDAVDVLLFNPQTLTLEYAASRGFRARAVERTRLRLGEGPAGRAALERRPVSIANLGQAGGEFPRPTRLAAEGFVTYYGVPLIAKRQIKGVLEIFHRTPMRPVQEWMSFLETLAGQAAIAIDNLELFTDLQQSNFQLALAYDATIEGWTRALDLRDKETEGHTQRVIDLTIRMARAMGIGENDLVHVRRGAFLHDMGKMGIPDAIHLKPDKLTDEEWAIMRRHPQYAYDMIAPIEYLRPAIDIPYCHHERWDGSGYPRGLKGEEIPLAARLFATVDVWDAVTSERPYRQAWSQVQALEHIAGQAGKHFDPRAVQVFFDVLKQT